MPRGGGSRDVWLAETMTSDSRASRLLQAADLIAYAQWRHDRPPNSAAA
jgi:hypothetical protein